MAICFIQYEENDIWRLNLLRAEVKVSLSVEYVRVIRTKSENSLCCVASDAAFECHRPHFRRTDFTRFAGRGRDTGIWRGTLRQGRPFVVGFLAFQSLLAKLAHARSVNLHRRTILQSTE